MIDLTEYFNHFLQKHQEFHPVNLGNFCDFVKFAPRD